MKVYFSILFLFLSLSSQGQTTNKYSGFVDSMLARGENTRLLGYLRKELKTHPRDEELYRVMGYVFVRSNMKDSGEKYYNAALKINPKCSGCYMNIAVIYAQSNHYDRAVEYVDKAIAIEPVKGALYFLRAKIKDMQGDTLSALFDFNKAIEFDSSNVEYYLVRGAYNIRQKYIFIGLADYTKAIELSPGNYHPLLQRAEVYFNQQEFDKSRADIMAALTIDSTLYEAYFGLAGIDAIQNNHQAAIEDYTKSLALKQDYQTYYYRAGERYKTEDMDGYCNDLHMCYDLLDKNGPQKELMEELVTRIKGICDSSEPSFYYQRGIAEFNTGNYQQAINIYRLGLKRFPDNCMLLSFAGNALYMLKEYEHALLSFEAAKKNRGNLEADVRLNPNFKNAQDDSVALYIKGLMAFMQITIAESKYYLGKNDEAIEAINKGLEMSPNLHDFPKTNYYEVRGNLYMDEGKYDLALADFNTCLQLDGNNSIVHISRAIAKVNLFRPMKVRKGFAGLQASTQTLSIGFTFPLNAALKSGSDLILSAFTDCDLAIEADPKLAYGYYIRAQIKKMCTYPDFCSDFLKAYELGYPVEPEILKDCRKD